MSNIAQINANYRGALHHLLEDVPIVRWKLLENYQNRAARVRQDRNAADRLRWSGQPSREDAEAAVII